MPSSPSGWLHAAALHGDHLDHAQRLGRVADHHFFTDASRQGQHLEPFWKKRRSKVGGGPCAGQSTWSTPETSGTRSRRVRSMPW